MQNVDINPPQKRPCPGSMLGALWRDRRLSVVGLTWAKVGLFNQICSRAPMPIDIDLGSKHDLHISSTTPFFPSRLDRDMREITWRDFTTKVHGENMACTHKTTSQVYFPWCLFLLCLEFNSSWMRGLRSGVAVRRKQAGAPICIDRKRYRPCCLCTVQK